MDDQLPVKVEAAVALQYLIKNQSDAETFIQPHVRPIIKVQGSVCVCVCVCECVKRAHVHVLADDDVICVVDSPCGSLPATGCHG